MIEEPDADEIAQTNLTFWEEVNIIVVGVHCPEIQNISENMIKYNQGALWISAHEGEETEPIEIEGEDENSTDHDLTWTISLDVEKEKHDVLIYKKILSNDILKCDRSTQLTVGVINIGQEDEDDTILEYLEDDGDPVEPMFYCPIIPMVLVNGSKGIGTGFSTDILSYDPKKIIQYLKQKLTQAK